jgi:hypothetical protein
LLTNISQTASSPYPLIEAQSEIYFRHLATPINGEHCNTSRASRGSSCPADRALEGKPAAPKRGHQDTHVEISSETGDDDVWSKRRKVSLIAGDDGTNSISTDNDLASTAETTPTFEYTRQTEPPLCPQVIGADQDWEIRKIVGKEDIDGVLHYLVEWSPTLLPEHALGQAKELVDKFEARLRAQREANKGRGGQGLKRGDRAVVGGRQQKRPRGRPRKQT